MRRPGAAIGLALLLACSGCVSGGEHGDGDQATPDGQVDDESTRTAEPDAAEEANDPEGSGGPDGSEEPDGAQAPDRSEEADGSEADGSEAVAGEPCDEAATDAVAATIAGQLEAFADDDFERALGFASTGFQAGIDVGAFQDLIETQFPTVADPSEHTVELCVLIDPGVAQVRVEVTGDDGARSIMGYVLVEQDRRWGIEAATEISRSAGRVA